jgi:hypothetical protein
MHSERPIEFGTATQARGDANGGKFTPNETAATGWAGDWTADGGGSRPSCHRSAAGYGR